MHNLTTHTINNLTLTTMKKAKNNGITKDYFSRNFFDCKELTDFIAVTWIVEQHNVIGYVDPDTQVLIPYPTSIKAAGALYKYLRVTVTAKGTPRYRQRTRYYGMVHGQGSPITVIRTLNPAPENPNKFITHKYARTALGSTSYSYLRNVLHPVAGAYTSLFNSNFNFVNTK